MKASRRTTPSPVAAGVPAREPLLYLRTDEQWEAITSDVRLEVVQWLTSIGPCSIASLARAMGAAADGLYHHVRVLLACGIIRDAGERHTGRRRERLYDAAAERLRLDVDVAAGRNIGRLSGLLRAHARRAESALERGLRARDVRLEGPIADTLFDSASAWLDDETAEKVRRHLQSAAQIMASRRRLGRPAPPAPAARLYSMSMVLCPATGRRGGSAWVRAAVGE